MEKEDRKKAMALRPTVQVGKGGVTENIISETMGQIKKNGMVKVKFIQSKEDIEVFLERLSGQATLVMKVGKTVVFKKKER